MTVQNKSPKIFTLFTNNVYLCGIEYVNGFIVGFTRLRGSSRRFKKKVMSETDKYIDEVIDASCTDMELNDYYPVAAKLAIAMSISDLAKSIDRAFGTGIDGVPAFLEKISMVLEDGK